MWPITTDEIPWHKPLYKRRGAISRLCGISVFHDFLWIAAFPDERTQFRNGTALAQVMLEGCPTDKEAALLLTRDADAVQGHLNHPHYHLLVINIDRYLQETRNSAATAYLARLGSLDPVAISGFKLTGLDREQLAALADVVDLDFLQSWLKADPQRLAQVVQLLREFDGGLRAVIAGAEQETIRHLVDLLGDEAWERIASTGIEFPSLLAHRQIWRDRRNDCEEFREHLAAGDWAEADWQRFFEERTWIFGYGLRYQFLHALQDRPYVGGRGFSRRGGQESDFLMATAADVRFTVLVEIKNAQSELVHTDSYRNRTYAPGSDLAGGVVQVQQACWRWAIEGSRTVDAQESLDPQDIFTHEPHGILVIGKLADLRDSHERIRSFESFRRNLRLPEVLTFDELLTRAEQMVASGEEVREVPIVDSEA